MCSVWTTIYDDSVILVGFDGLMKLQSYVLEVEDMRLSIHVSAYSYSQAVILALISQ